MQEVGCVASPGDLLLRPTVFVTDQESMAEGAVEGAVLKELAGGGAGGGPAW